MGIRVNEVGAVVISVTKVFLSQTLTHGAGQESGGLPLLNFCLHWIF